MKKKFELVLKIFAALALVFLVYIAVIKSIDYFNSWNKADLVPIVKPKVRFGIPVEPFRIVNGMVHKDQFVSDILQLYGVDLGTIDQIARKSADVFDVRKVRSDRNYTMFISRDSLQKARYFVYEINSVDYVVYQLFDSLCIYKASKVIESRIKTIQGEIETSLWNTMQDNGLDPTLALTLSNVYDWTIDFYALQKGDRFKAIYDEIYVDSVSVGIGKIYAAEFIHYGKSYMGFRFTQSDTTGYYNETGQSLKKEFLKAPLEFSRISSHFSSARLHPILRIVRPHYGVDYAAPKGTPVRTIGEGTVISKGYAGGGGNQLKIKHNSVYTTQYMHLSGYADGIFEGARVRQGQVIGFVGATGLASGPHLDFRVYKNGTPVNPLTVESAPAKPVSLQNMPQFTVLKDSLLSELQKVKWKQNQHVH